MLILRMIDILGPELKLKIRQKDTYKTKIGGFFTLIFVLLVSLAIGSEGLDMIYRKKPLILYKKQKDFDQSFNLNSENFAFSIFNQENDTIIPNLGKMFTIYLEVFENYNGKYNTSTYNFERCQNETIQRKKDNLRVNSSEYWCLPKNVSIIINGTFLFGKFTSSRLSVDFCINGTKNRTDCMNISDIKAALNNVNMNIIFDNYYTDYLNYSEPFIPTYHIENIISNENTFSRKVFYFKKMIYETDYGWVMSDNYTMEKQVFDSSEFSFTFDQNTKSIFSIMIVNSNNKDLYQRSYVKFQEIFSYIGGFISLIQILLKIICEFLIYPGILHIFYKKYHLKKILPVKILSNLSKINELQNKNSEQSPQLNILSKSIKNVEMQIKEREKYVVENLPEIIKENTIKLELNVLSESIKNDGIQIKEIEITPVIKIPEESKENTIKPELNVLSESLKNNDIQIKKSEKSPVLNLTEESKQITFMQELRERKNSQESRESRVSVLTKKIPFKLIKFTVCDKLSRIFFCCWKIEKKNQFEILDRLFTNKLSVEHFMKLSRKISMIEGLLLQRYQRELIKYVGVPKFEKIYKSYDESLKKLNTNITDPINQNLKRFLNNEFD